MIWRRNEIPSLAGVDEDGVFVAEVPSLLHETRCVQLASVVSNPRDPTLQVINEGCIGALDTQTGDFEFLEGDWLGAYGRQGGFPLLAETLEEIRP